jgi:signal transduction histidine kinase
VSPAIARLARTIERLSGERGLVVEVHDPGGLRFAGEQQDFEEMVGNLLDNAGKWARKTVRIDLEVLPTDHSKPMFAVEVSDDGPGLDDEECRKALSRGARLDETKPGSGLGLSIVSELVTLYGGRISLDRSSLGGLRARLELPLLQS